MDKRDFLKFVFVSAVLKGVPQAFAMPPELGWSGPAGAVHGKRTPKKEPQKISSAAAGDAGPDLDKAVKDRLMKSRFFDHDFEDDIFLDSRDIGLLHSSLKRLKRIQRTVGYGNYALLDFDQALALSKNYSSIGRFLPSEIQFLEKIFYAKGSDYGFFGEKPIEDITGVIRKKEVQKIPRTGNYLYRGKPMQVYEAVKKQVGREIVLTSGVRGIMKQFLLFLDKVSRSRGNLSMASRSLAPPGYSFHGTGDFDVGQKGFGVYNFTEKFIETKVYKRLNRLGYVKFRYSRDNDLGVRFEPWHIGTV
ncbi:M15 family metallopeptidase [Desulfospira joergensenii]|uniref:M15 family metallopeptidase n=1 Tax=Desulfospira joergensenii TaxID=53329 RepID=UPI0003B6712E|nr:M15 family metallopeptidase [Desulfospira joergensenii]